VEYGQDDDNLGGIMAAADLDGDGTLNYEEFIAATANLNKLEKEANILAAFNKFDTDHSGALTKDEIREALNSMGSTDEEIEVRIITVQLVSASAGLHFEC
jgi:calcium-dependent protein kinase